MHTKHLRPLLDNSSPLPPVFLRRFAIFNLVAVTGIALGAFTLSFDTQRHLAIQSGVSLALAWILPVVIDLTVLALTATATHKKLSGKPITWEVCMVAGATLLSLFFNIYLAPKGFQQAETADGAYFPDMIPIIVATVAIHSVPPLFLFAMVETVALSIRSLLPNSFPHQPQSEADISQQGTSSNDSDSKQATVTSQSPRTTNHGRATRQDQGGHGHFVAPSPTNGSEDSIQANTDSGPAVIDRGPQTENANRARTDRKNQRRKTLVEAAADAPKTHKDLATEFGVSTKTIQRDFNAIDPE